MRWGNVFYNYLCCHIYYCILYNEKADEKPKKNRTEPWQHYLWILEWQDKAPWPLRNCRYGRLGGVVQRDEDASMAAVCLILDRPCLYL